MLWYSVLYRAVVEGRAGLLQVDVLCRARHLHKLFIIQLESFPERTNTCVRVISGLRSTQHTQILWCTTQTQRNNPSCQGQFILLMCLCPVLLWSHFPCMCFLFSTFCVDLPHSLTRMISHLVSKSGQWQWFLNWCFRKTKSHLPYGLCERFGGVLRHKHVAGKSMVCWVLRDETKIPADNTEGTDTESVQSAVKRLRSVVWTTLIDV